MLDGLWLQEHFSSPVVLYLGRATVKKCLCGSDFDLLDVNSHLCFLQKESPVDTAGDLIS